MSEINRPVDAGAEAVYDEYADSYKTYCELPKEKLKPVRKYFKKIREDLDSLDKTFAKKGEQ